MISGQYRTYCRRVSSATLVLFSSLVGVHELLPPAPLHHELLATALTWQSWEHGEELASFHNKLNSAASFFS